MNQKKIEKIAEENFQCWRKALLSNDPHKVASLYAHQATFLPTMSPDFKLGDKEAEGYFEHFLQSHPDGKTVNARVQPVGAHCYLHCGLYNFEVDDEKGKRKVVEARFSYLWKKKTWWEIFWEAIRSYRKNTFSKILSMVFHSKNNWKIVHHHSSLRPSR